eukprot:1592994-Amphidinium_carterae.1
MPLRMSEQSDTWGCLQPLFAHGFLGDHIFEASVWDKQVRREICPGWHSRYDAPANGCANARNRLHTCESCVRTHAQSCSCSRGEAGIPCAGQPLERRGNVCLNCVKPQRPKQLTEAPCECAATTGKLVVRKHNHDNATAQSGREAPS